MSTTLFAYPQRANFGRVLPKVKIYEHASVTAAVKRLIIDQVDRAVWQYKLAPETLNLPATSDVPEIQIFRIELKEPELKTDVLKCIDKAIKFPVLFELSHADNVRVTATYKRPSEADQTKWVIGDYYESTLLPVDSPRTPLPVTLNLETLYAKLLEPLMPFPMLGDETLPQQVERISQIRVRERALKKCEAKLRRERQFNRKVAINAELRALRNELEELTGSTSEDLPQRNV